MIRTIVIDDEEDGRESLRLSLEKFCPDVEVVSICDGPLTGMKCIEHFDPDLVFLDVQMPHMSGFDMLEKIEKPRFKVIFCTAHDKYAIKAIRFAAIDYLLKPVDVDDLVSAVARVKEKQDADREVRSVLHNVKHRMGQEGKLAIPSSEGMDFIDIRDVIYFKADGNYSTIHIKDKKPLLVSKNLKEFENVLDPEQYCRVHHSSIINLSYLESYVKGEGGYVVMANGDHVTVSRRKKEEFMRLIDKV